jgi:hypothetical protein
LTQKLPHLGDKLRASQSQGSRFIKEAHPIVQAQLFITFPRVARIQSESIHHSPICKEDLNPKTEIEDKPQIAQISPMTEANMFSADSHENSTGTKKHDKGPWLFLL